MTTLQDQITADTQAVADAQTKLTSDTAADQAAIDAANATLAADQAKQDAIAPHLSVLDQIDAVFAQFDAGLATEITAAVDAIKQQITPLVAQIRSLLTSA